MVGQIVCITYGNPTRNLNKQLSGERAFLFTAILPLLRSLFFFSPPTHTFFLGMVDTVYIAQAVKQCCASVVPSVFL